MVSPTDEDGSVRSPQRTPTRASNPQSQVHSPQLEVGNRQPRFGGVALLLIAATLWSLNGALIKLTYDEGRGPDGVTIAFYRSLFAGLFLLPFAWGRFHTLRNFGGCKSRLPIRPAALICMVFFTLMTLCFVVATTKTEAANAIILQYTSTIWIFGLSPLILREKPGRGAVGILVLAMTGVAVIFAGSAGTNLVGLAIGLAAGLFFALEIMLIRRMRDSDAAAVVVLNLLGSALLLAPAAICAGNLTANARVWLLLVALGVVQFGLPYYLFARALKRVEAYQANLIVLAEPVLVPVWAYLAVGETVPITTVVGGGVILLSLVLLIRGRA